MPTSATSSTKWWTSGLLLVTALASGQWQTNSIDTLTPTPGRCWVGLQAVAVDDAGTLHAAWSEDGAGGARCILYARRPSDSAWSVPDTVTGQAGSAPALGVEPASGRPHVAYNWPSDAGSDVYYATPTDSGWQPVRLTDNDHYDISPTIALEGDRPHVAWITVDSTDAYRIGYASNRSGSWSAQMLLGSQLGGFGTGAAPFLAVEPGGRAHVSYRGGDYNDYSIHHAENRSPGDTAWDYEILSSVNLQDYSSALAAGDSGELLLALSGNDGWGMPFRSCYLRRVAGAPNWDPYQLMTGSSSAALRGFAVHGSAVHITWERISGNIATGELYHCSNASGSWFCSDLRPDGMTHSGALVMDASHAGHCLAVSGPGLDSQQVFCIHSEPFTSVEERRTAPGFRARAATLCRAPVRIAALGVARVGVYSAAGTLARTLPAPDADEVLWDGLDHRGRPAPTGTYVARIGERSTAFVLLR